MEYVLCKVADLQPETIYLKSLPCVECFITTFLWKTSGWLYFFKCCVKPVIEKFKFTAKQLLTFLKQLNGVFVLKACFDKNEKNSPSSDFLKKSATKSSQNFETNFKNFLILQSQRQLNSLTLIWVEGQGVIFPPPPPICWFINSEIVKPVILAFSNIQ